MSAHEAGSHGADASDAEVTLTSLDSAEDGLRAASLLLARHAPQTAVHALHVAAAQVLRRSQGASLPESYQSLAEAEEQHRRLLCEASALRAHLLRRSGKPGLWRLLPMLASWLIAFSVGAGLSIRYAAGVLDRSRWQHQHPDGPWVSRYYWNRKFEGSPLIRYDVGINYNWGRSAPADAMLRDRWSARWDTCLLVRQDLSLKLGLHSDDAARLYIDEVPLLRNTKPGTKTRKVRLRAGVRHVRVDFQEGPGNAVIRLTGLNFAGTDAYEFRRPALVNDQAHCQDAAPPLATTPPLSAGEDP